jgi:hypothetical protein
MAANWQNMAEELAGCHLGLKSCLLTRQRAKSQ